MFNKITKESANFEAVAKTFETLGGDRFDWDGLAREFNALESGELVTFEFRAGKSSAVKNNLEKRGLQNGIDFTLRTADKKDDAENQLVFLRRESDKAPTAIVRTPRAAKAAGDGSGTESAPSANAKGKGKGK